MFEFINKIFKNKKPTEEEKISIIELVHTEESFINPRDLIAEQERQKIAQKKAEKRGCGNGLDQLRFSASKNE